MKSDWENYFRTFQNESKNQNAAALCDGGAEFKALDKHFNAHHGPTYLPDSLIRNMNHV